MHTHLMPRAPRVAPVAFAAILMLGACGSDGDGTAEQPPATPATTAPTSPGTSLPTSTPTSPPTTTPTSTIPDSTIPTSTSSPVAPDNQLYEVISSVIEDANGPKLCFVVLESLPPQCGTGLVLNNWSWDDITVEQSQNDITWVDSIYVTGTYDADAQTFTVDTAALPTDADRERLLLSRPLPDFSVPCDPPTGGWQPGAAAEWPADAIAALDGYAGSWIDESQQVLTVKFTGDPDVAESAVREHYTGPLCVVGAEHSAAELAAIQQQLSELSSIQLLGTSTYVDASGEWVEAQTIAPDAERQAAFDAEFGRGIVRLRSILTPVAGA